MCTVKEKERKNNKQTVIKTESQATDDRSGLLVWNRKENNKQKTNTLEYNVPQKMIGLKTDSLCLVLRGRFFMILEEIKKNKKETS